MYWQVHKDDLDQYEADILATLTPDSESAPVASEMTDTAEGSVVSTCSLDADPDVIVECIEELEIGDDGTVKKVYMTVLLYTIPRV